MGSSQMETSSIKQKQHLVAQKEENIQCYKKPEQPETGCPGFLRQWGCKSCANGGCKIYLCMGEESLIIKGTFKERKEIHG